MSKLISTLIFIMNIFENKVYAKSLPSITPTDLVDKEQRFYGISQWILFGVAICIIFITGIEIIKMKKEKQDPLKISEYFRKMFIIFICVTSIAIVLGWCVQTPFPIDEF